MNTADLKQPGTIATAAALKTQALEGLNQPKHWHGEDDTANRATAEAADNPTNKSLESEQDDIAEMILELCYFTRDQAEIAGTWHPTPDLSGEITVQMPEIARKDLTKVAGVLNQIVQAITIAHIDLKVVSLETVAMAIAKILAELGIEYDPIAELQKVAGQGGEVDMATANAANQFLSGLMNGGNDAKTNDDTAVK